MRAHIQALLETLSDVMELRVVSACGNTLS